MYFLNLFTKVDNRYIIDVVGGKWFVSFATVENGYFGGFVWEKPK